MVIASGGEPTHPEAEAFLARWPSDLERRLTWFVTETDGDLQLDGETTSLDLAAAWVAGRLGDEGSFERAPDWYGAALVERGWTAYGCALVEGLIAYVSSIYASQLGRAVLWVLDQDQRSAYYLRPVVDAPGITPWRQVLGAVGTIKAGGPADRLRGAVERTLEHHHRLMVDETPAAATSEPERWVELTPAGRGEWQVSFPEDIAERLGQPAYAQLEDRMAAVDGVREAIMEDRDRATVRTARTVGGADLTARLEATVAPLAHPA